jgi:hypothetical protein
MDLTRWSHRTLLLICFCLIAGGLFAVGGLAWSIPFVVLCVVFYVWLFVWLGRQSVS